MPSCDYCRGPITGSGNAGRPWPGRPAAVYCCYGCLSLGEHRQWESASRALPGAGWNVGGVGIRLGISVIVVAQSMIFGLALNLHDDVPEPARWVAQSLILCGTLLVVALLGPQLFRAAWHELRRGRITIEALFLLTMTGAMAASLQAFVTGRGKLYFEVVSVLLVVYALGKVIGSRSRAAAIAGARAWAGQLNSCRLVDARGEVRVVPVTDVRPGDTVEVNPGETFAVDGVIRSGVGFASEAAVTGEPFAVVRRPGDRVLAGAASRDASFRVEVTAAGTARQVDSLLAAVESARDRPMSLQSQADAIGRWFFPLVVLTALGTFLYWSLLTPAGWGAGLFNAMSVLLIACPCVIGLATPIVIWSALCRLAERGLIVRAGDVVERLANVDLVLFDKTGTLTEERLTLLDIVTAAGGEERARLLGWLAAVESRCEHPVARAFSRLPGVSDQDVRVHELKAIPGCGVVATLGAAGVNHRLHIGRPEWIATTSKNPQGCALDSRLLATGHRVDVSLDGVRVAAAVVGEQLRDSTPAALAAFRRMGLPVEVLTGDTTERAAALALPGPRGNLLPDEKRLVVDAARAVGGNPLFVGDGINDAAALASAHVGIALSSGADLAVSAADITLYHADLRVLPWAIEFSREAVRAVRRNLYRALCYNIIGMTLAACGLLHPVAAVLLMTVASLSLVASSTRIGAGPEHCSSAEELGDTVPSTGPTCPNRATAFRARVHAMGFGLQGIVFISFLESARSPHVALPLLTAFAAGGWFLARRWLRWSTIPHALDMCFAMLTLGNLGMLLGWWADNGFAPLRDGGCCECAEAVRAGTMGSPWMWVGMLAFANAGMIWLGRNPGPRAGGHTLAMFTGGNLGMLLGMAAGGWCAAQAACSPTWAAVMIGFGGMTAGMLAGMLLGTRVTEMLFGAARWLGRVPSTRRQEFRHYRTK